MNPEVIIQELRFKAIRSSGPGGQNVNKTASKIELSFDVENSLGLSANEKERIRAKLGKRLTKEGLLIIQCDTARSQHQNKNLALKRFFELLKKALRVQKKRKPTKPSKSSIEKRLNSKGKTSEKKANRRKPSLD